MALRVEANDNRRGPCLDDQAGMLLRPRAGGWYDGRARRRPPGLALTDDTSEGSSFLNGAGIAEQGRQRFSAAAHFLGRRDWQGQRVGGPTISQFGRHACDAWRDPSL